LTDGDSCRYYEVSWFWASSTPASKELALCAEYVHAVLPVICDKAVNSILSTI
jgi:hypothetical protein